VAVLGVVCTAIAFLVFFALIAEVGNVRATTITYVNPAVALALGVAVLGEQFTVGAVAGFGLILIGLFLGTKRTATSEGLRNLARDAEMAHHPIGGDGSIAAPTSDQRL
jgi:drug/metabolite transporter (DMT)-like permease